VNDTSVLTRNQARTFYDRFGSRQDKQGFYEDPAITELIDQARFDEARRVVEFGSGTGRLAERLLQSHLDAQASYWCCDLSATMTRLATERLASFGGRVTIEESTGDPELPLADGSADRFLSTYVLDLLCPEEIDAVLAEADRILSSDGLLCLVGITPGPTQLSAYVMRLWQRIHASKPSWVGGCRPVDMRSRLLADTWLVRYWQIVTAWGISSEVIVAEKRNDSPFNLSQSPLVDD
jgi:ubiquinone/menaquinone biosynthesis C-methylase UbiE